ncbi:hypothetical protein C8R45DRAFT_1055709 [Mycena sanguinolenta]|nr:hypothetical protein C8R45DRAFT_1055709 [Mycena sanguinolenta]
MGSVLSVYNANWPPRAKWSVHQIPDVSGKIIIVTGGNGGIGKEIVKALLLRNAKVYIASHNKARVDAAIDELERATQKKALFMELDLASISSVKAAAQVFQSLERKLDVLINNARDEATDAVTKDGYDLQFGHYYFTRLLIPEILAAGSSRIVTVTSHGHTLVDGIKWETIRDGPERRKAFGRFAISTTKASLRYGDQGVVSTSVHPGVIATNLGPTISPFLMWIAPCKAFVQYDSIKGALTSLYAATSPETLNANGKYLIPWARLGKANSSTHDAELGTKLWAWLE